MYGMQRFRPSVRELGAALSVGVALALAAGCGQTDDDAIKAAKLSAGCVINTDCEDPLVCAFRRCHNECETSRDCTEGQRCVASDRPFRVCQLDDETNCERNSDCAFGMVCGVDGECRDQCGTSRDCIPGQVCTAGSCADEEELVDGKLPIEVNLDDPVSANRPCLYHSDCDAPLVCRGGDLRRRVPGGAGLRGWVPVC